MEDKLRTIIPLQAADEEEKELLSKMTVPLLQWYDVHKRNLPWRNEPDAYHVWVSEIMLQQTRVEAVKGYYKRFLDALPDIEQLAQAPEEVLLKLWEGLGYYNRVRNMQKAAGIVVEQYSGVLPADYKKLLSLPGIGSYTAGAIGSIAYGIAVPAVDGNVLRVVMRLLERSDDILKQSVKKQVELWLGQTMSKERPGAYNQALMELGATICVPNGAPDCRHCPVSGLCRGYQHGTAMKLPYKTPKKQRRIEKKTVVILSDTFSTIVHKRNKRGLLAGLYEIPNVEGHLSEEDVLAWVKQEGFQAVHIEPLPEAKHIFSHVEWHMKAYRVRIYDTVPGERKDVSQEDAEHPYLAVEREKIVDEIPIPSAFSYYQEYL